ncbi:MAG TPA: TraB/GumN family protein [Sphingomicrobium sp.]|nr:TraB/GumN family protein [Sphingomicrobium sp.]
MAILPLLFGASIAVAPLPQATPASIAPVARPAPHPALWVVNDNDTIIYLFGTFHALDGKTDWFDRAVKTAFSQSDELMLETLVPRPGEIIGWPDRVPAARPGPERPSPVAQLAPSASFLATTKLVMKAGRTKGLSTDRGADAILRDAADYSGKKVAGLESFEFQLNMFKALPPAQPPSSSQDPRTVQALGAVLTQLEAAWSHGNLETFAPLLKQMQAQSPRTYRSMFVERNARWAHWIADRLQTPGTIFVAVGAGHLSGPDSVQNQLATMGVKSARVN